jgi:UPF0755 protein
MAKGKKSTRKRVIRAILVLLAVILSGAAIIGYQYYKFRYRSNIELGGPEKTYLYIPTGSDFDAVKKILVSKHYLIDEYSFQWLSEKKGYTASVKPGRYLLKNHMTNNTLINMLRSGQQEPVKFTFNNIRTRDQLAARVGQMLEADSASVLELMNNTTYLQEKYHMSADEIMCIFIPNTYEFYWNTSAEEFIKRMYKEYSNFWNTARQQKASAMGLDPVKVTILASIIDQESKKIDEIPRIAGVYTNRLNKNMVLQADPTVIFAVGDFSIKRVLKRHTEYESPYNTYLHTGLPPGPICLPSPKVIDATLAYEKHDYLYFCAKDDFSGYHNFAKTLAQHNQNAALYQQALSRYMKKHKK